VLRSRATSSDPSRAFLQVRGSPLVPFRHRSTGLIYFGTKRPPVHVPALRAAVGSLDPGCDDVRIAGRDDALGLQSVQAGAYRPFRQPGVADQRGYRRECACAVRPGMVGQADQHELARAGRPGRGRPGRVPRLSAHEIASTLTGHPPAAGKPTRSAVWTWSQFWSHSPLSRAVHWRTPSARLPRPGMLAAEGGWGCAVLESV
jgi:hypothetical protein